MKENLEEFLVAGGGVVAAISDLVPMIQRLCLSFVVSRVLI